MPEPETPDFGVVILTMGKRRKRLGRAIASVLRQRDVSTDVLVVGNGWDPSVHIQFPSVRTLALRHNIGIPAGRNAGVDKVEGRLLFFLDDDAELASDTVLRDIRRRMNEFPDYGAVQGRVSDRKGKEAPTRWVPRIGGRVPDHPMNAFSLWEGAVAVRRSVFLSAGGWPADYFYAHEGIELAWRVWEQRMQVVYDPDLPIYHPVKPPTRHDQYYQLSARNRVWCARRNLPAPLSVVYATNWAIIQVARSWRHPSTLKPWFEGWWAGWRECPRDQPKMGWKSVWFIARNGRLLVL
ncbi:glycosyltransferase family 2 protein [Demequina globuliformis]|uniref:glycosyltransferase family 2 protein n=1 Tax=Demequina globuliformis TaxID=676202 RepID=UPI00078359B0|nr:glycosyltransferase [Demequina globuliformis]